MEAVLWVVLALALAVGEAFAVSFLIIFFSAGALAAAGAAALGAPLLLQVIVFAIVSGLSVGAVRPIIMRNRRSALESGETPFGIEALPGRHGTVLEQVGPDAGLVKVDGEMWRARSFDGHEVYAEGERVRILEVKDATVIVWRDETTDV